MTNPNLTYLPDAKRNKPPTPELKFTNAEKFKKEVEGYFESISMREEIYETLTDKNGESYQKSTGKWRVEWIEPPTIVGLGVYMDCDYRIFLDYERGMHDNHPQMTPELSMCLKHSLARARQICHKYALGQVFLAKSANGPTFVLRTVYKDHGYQEETNININKLDDKEAKSVSQLSTDELIKIQSTIDTIMQSAITQKLHQDDQENAEDADFDDLSEGG